MPASRGIARRAGRGRARPWPFYQAAAFSLAPATEAHRGNRRSLSGSAPACGQRLRRGGAWRAGAVPGAGLPRGRQVPWRAEEETLPGLLGCSSE